MFFNILNRYSQSKKTFLAACLFCGLYQNLFSMDRKRPEPSGGFSAQDEPLEKKSAHCALEPGAIRFITADGHKRVFDPHEVRRLDAKLVNDLQAECSNFESEVPLAGMPEATASILETIATLIHQETSQIPAFLCTMPFQRLIDIHNVLFFLQSSWLEIVQHAISVVMNTQNFLRTYSGTVIRLPYSTSQHLVQMLRTKMALSTLQSSAKFDTHDAAITGVAFLKNDTAAIGSLDGVISIWNLKNNACIQTIRPLGFDGNPVTHIMHLSLTQYKNNELLLASSGREIYLLSCLSTGIWKVIRRIQPPVEKIRQIALTPDQQHLVIASELYMVFIAHINNLTVWQRLNAYQGGMAFAITPQGNVITGSDFWSYSVFNPINGQRLLTIGNEENRCNTSRVLTALTEHQFASGWDGSGAIYIWNLEHGTLVRKLEGHTDGISCLTTVKPLILASGSRDHTACVWDLASGLRLQRLAGRSGAISSITTTPDSRIITGSDLGKVQVWQSTLPELNTLSLEQLLLIFKMIHQLYENPEQRDHADLQTYFDSLPRETKTWLNRYNIKFHPREKKSAPTPNSTD